MCIDISMPPQRRRIHYYSKQKCNLEFFAIILQVKRKASIIEDVSLKH
jgi:hypothetical protein